VWVRAIRARAPLPTNEVEPVESHLVAPAGLFPTAAEREAMERERPLARVGGG
jgi:carbon starvation protein